MSTVAVAGQVQEYVSNIEFSLNFEEPKKLTTKVRVGDIVFFDGVTARHINKLTGEEKTGKAIPLKSAIQNNWLSLNVDGVQVGPINVKTNKIRDNIVYKDPDYDPLKGGSFDDYLKKSGDIGAGSKVIRENDLVVKKVAFDGKTPVASKTDKMKVVSDQVAVKTEGTTVSNSTSVAAQKSRATTKVTQADDGQADHVIVKGKKTEAQVPVKNKNTFTVDSFTPAVQEGATLDEVRKATVKFDGAQDGKVVKKIGSAAPKMPAEPMEVEGIVLKKTDFSNKPSQGSTPVADLSGVNTQAEVDDIEKTLEKKAAPKEEKKNYVDMLPDDWSGMHWVKKEKFIMAIDDIEFLKFIMKVESVKAVHAACRKRMTELAKAQK